MLQGDLYHVNAFLLKSRFAIDKIEFPHPLELLVKAEFSRTGPMLEKLVAPMR